MKRSGPPKRKAPLARKPSSSALRARSGQGGAKTSRKPLQRAKAVLRVLEPGEASWKRRRSGTCEVCGTYGPIVLHHVVDKGLLKRVLSEEQIAAGMRWDQERNALRIGAPFVWGGKCRCHDRHTTPGIRDDDRLSYSLVTPTHRAFAVEALGEGPALEYFRRHYRDVPDA